MVSFTLSKVEKSVYYYSLEDFKLALFINNIAITLPRLLKGNNRHQQASILDSRPFQYEGILSILFIQADTHVKPRTE